MMGSHSKRIEILLVEDNPGDQLLMTTALKGSTMVDHVSIANDGEEALAMLRQEGEFGDVPKPDLILLDLNLPKLSGQEVLEIVKGDSGLKRIPVCVLTTSKSDVDIQAAYDSHANCFITKPVDFNQFSRIVADLENFWFNLVKLPNN